MMPVTNAAPGDRVGERLADKYELTAVIGRGGAGVVYSAIQHPLGRPVAVKMTRSDVTDAAPEELAIRFQREAAVSSALSHPNVVQIFDFGVTSRGECFVVMELMDGRTLRDAVRGTALDGMEVARITIGILRGLRHAHAKGLVHRDIKPSNILLVPDDEGVEQPKLIDFGLVKGGDSDVTRTGTYMGTPSYIAPEQAMGSKDVDHRADLYAVGVLMYRMLVGFVPFRAEGPMATALAHVTEPYPEMSANPSAPRVDAHLEAVVRRAMAKNPDERFPTAADMIRALQDWSGASLSVTGFSLGPSAQVEPPSAGRSRIGRTALVAGLLGMCTLGGGTVVAAGVAYMNVEDAPVAAVSEVFEQSRQAEDKSVSDLISVKQAPSSGPTPRPEEPAETVSSGLQPAAEPRPVPAPAVIPTPTPVARPEPVARPAHALWRLRLCLHRSREPPRHPGLR